MGFRTTFMLDFYTGIWPHFPARWLKLKKIAVF